MLDYFKNIAREDTASSTMRWVLIFVTIFTTVLFWGTWIIVSIMKAQVVDIPTGAVTAYSAGNASAILGKVVQKIFGEKDNITEDKLKKEVE
jgi:predicted permease